MNVSISNLTKKHFLCLKQLKYSISKHFYSLLIAFSLVGKIVIWAVLNTLNIQIGLTEILKIGDMARVKPILGRLSLFFLMSLSTFFGINQQALMPRKAKLFEFWRLYIFRWFCGLLKEIVEKCGFTKCVLMPKFYYWVGCLTKLCLNSKRWPCCMI